MSADVDDIAAALIGALGPMSAMKLQKLVYYVQARHLVDYGAPAFVDPIEAWAAGPVVRRLFDRHRGLRKLRDWAHGNATALPASVASVVRSVMQRYGRLSAEELSDITHREAPWRSARGGLPEGARSEQPISLEVMRRFYARQGGDPDSAVQDVLASARLEGAEATEVDVALLRAIASGSISAADAIERIKTDALG